MVGRCIWLGGKGVENRWGLAVFSSGAPNYNLSKMEGELVYIVERLFGPWPMVLNSLFVLPLFLILFFPFFVFFAPASYLHF